MPYRVAVTGGAGFLGTYLLRCLREEMPEASLVAVVRDATRAPLPGVVCADKVPASDLVFHLAGSAGIERSLADPCGDLLDNALGTVEVLEAVRRVDGARLVLASSVAVYGPAEGIVSEDHPLRPVSPYGVSKLAAEAYAHAYGRLYGIDACIARIGNPYGPGQRRRVVYDLARRAIGEPPPLRVRGTGVERRDFVHAADVARALVTIARHGVSGQAYNVGSGRTVSLRELAALVARAAGLAEGAVCLDGAAPPGTVAVFQPSVARLAALGYRPAMPLEHGIAETVAWVRSA